MLAWVCHLIVASDDAYFADPCSSNGYPRRRIFRAPVADAPRAAKEFLFLGERIDASTAKDYGMVNRVVAREVLEKEVLDIAARIGKMPSLGLALAKRAVNQCEDLMDLRSRMDSVFGLHHAAHAHNAEIGSDALAGQDARSMRDERKAAEAE